MTDSGKHVLQTGAVRIAGLIIVCLFFTSEAAAQRSKSKRKDDPAFAPKENDYAYETEATTKRKVKQKGQTGNSGFRVEKPRQATAFTPLDRTYDYAKPPYFGHKKPVVIRPAGQQKLCRVCGIRH
jgi:hypothetical protein